MTAGTGIAHSEFNHSGSEPVHFLQIWIMPAARGLKPGYEQRNFPREERNGRLMLIASPDGRNGSVTVHQDVSLYSTLLDGDQSVEHDLATGRIAWVQVARGEVTLNGRHLGTGDGAAIDGESSIVLDGGKAAEILVFDMPEDKA